ncbi:hypothetical protein V8F20_006194 [Naviculisporaceae sp. PSN 640]
MFPKLITTLSFSISHLLHIVHADSLAGPGPQGLGCNTQGPSYANLTGGGAFDVQGSIADFCRRTTETIFYPYDARGGCYNFANNLCLDMSIANLNGSRMITLGSQGCVGYFETEFKGCSMGSRQVYGDFEVYIDPNVGACPSEKGEV